MLIRTIDVSGMGNGQVIPRIVNVLVTDVVGLNMIGKDVLTGLIGIGNDGFLEFYLTNGYEIRQLNALTSGDFFVLPAEAHTAVV